MSVGCKQLSERQAQFTGCRKLGPHVDQEAVRRLNFDSALTASDATYNTGYSSCQKDMDTVRFDHLKQDVVTLKTIRPRKPATTRTNHILPRESRIVDKPMEVSGALDLNSAK